MTEVMTVFINMITSILTIPIITQFCYLIFAAAVFGIFLRLLRLGR